MQRIRVALGLAVLAVIWMAPAPVSAQPMDPAAVIDAYTAAINAHDLEAALAFVSDDAVYMRPAGRYVGIAEVAEFIDGLIQQQVRIELIGERQVLRNYVTWTSRVTLTDPMNPNAPPMVLTNQSESIVRDGKIVFHMAARAPVAAGAAGAAQPQD
jgi:hypothetical protein